MNGFFGVPIEESPLVPPGQVYLISNKVDFPPGASSWSLYHRIMWVVRHGGIVKVHDFADVDKIVELARLRELESGEH